MKKYIILILVGMIFLSCKKETPEPVLTVNISQMSKKTSFTIIIKNQNKKTILEVTNKFENTTYKSLTVTSKDVLDVYYTSNIASDLEGNGNGVILISGPKYNNTIGGNLMGPAGRRFTIEIP